MPTTTRFTTRVALSRANIPPPPPSTPSVLRSNCPELEGLSALLCTQLTPPSSRPNPRSHSRHSPHNRTPRAEMELVAWAARLRYTNQEETKSFMSKLCELASQWEPSGLVKKVLTLVRSTTRSGTCYGLTACDRPKMASKLGSVAEKEGEVEGKLLEQQQFSLASPHRVNYSKPLGLENPSFGKVLSVRLLAASLLKEKRIIKAKRKRWLSRYRPLE